MTPSELREALNELEVTQVEFAKFVGVTDRAVRRWTSGDDRVPPPVAVLIGLLLAYPATQAGIKRRANLSRSAISDKAATLPRD